MKGISSQTQFKTPLYMEKPIAKPVEAKCCDECFLGSQDVNFGYGDVAVPEGCADQDCDCHSESSGELVSDCCGASMDEYCNDDTGFCSDCRDHCEYVELTEE